LAFWDELADDKRAELLEDIERIDFKSISKLIETYVVGCKSFTLPEDIQPAPFYPARPGMDLVGKYAEAVERGISLIRQNKVAAFTVAGGQGTRLEFAGPKGAFPISPVNNKPLFQLFAEFIIGTNRRYGADLTWYIMTSPQNDRDTREFFENNNYFGLLPERVRFFQQGVMPAFFPDGRILLDQKHRVSFSPDGHGGSLLALQRSGALAEMADWGIEYISYFQVDNPLVKAVDPLFVGLHEMTGAQMSSKTVPKADDLEKVGNFCVAGGKTMVIEYSDLPEELARSRDAKGNRRFDAASIAIHILSRSFVEQLTADETDFALGWHRAAKIVPYIDQKGCRIEPQIPNGVKLETFVFDAIALADNPLILQTVRADEFSPVKNKKGVDSVETARRDMNRRAAAWLEAAGFDVPKTAAGEPDGLFEISPALVPEAPYLREAMSDPPVIKAGKRHYWG